MLSADELSAYRFILAYEQDQRTQTGAEPGDTSLWRMQKDGLYQSGVQRHSVCTVEKKVQILLYIRTWLGCRWNCCSERRTTDD